MSPILKPRMTAAPWLTQMLRLFMNASNIWSLPSGRGVARHQHKYATPTAFTADLKKQGAASPVQLSGLDAEALIITG